MQEHPLHACFFKARPQIHNDLMPILSNTGLNKRRNSTRLYIRLLIIIVVSL